MRLSGCLLFTLWTGVTASTALAQAVFAPRATALAAYGALVHDTRGFTANPAGLVDMRDWDFTTATYIGTAQSGQSFVFSGFGMGKRFLENSALAFQYAPGTALDVLQPATLSIVGLNIPANKTISYGEPLALAYAYRLSEKFSAAIEGRMRTEKVSDPQYQFQYSDSAIVPVPKEFSSTTWFADIGVLWKPVEEVSVSAVARSLAHLLDTGLPTAYTSYALPKARDLEISASYRLTPSLFLASGVSTTHQGTLGAEWSPAGALALRAGIYASSDYSPFVYGYGLGIGFSYGFLEADASYLHFASQRERRGTVPSGSFDANAIKDVGLNAFTTDRAAFSVKAILGNIRESLARIEGVEMLGGIYPSAYQALAFKPVGTVRVRNTSRKPIQARASFFVERFMDQPTETAPTPIGPGGSVDIPFTAVFNDHVRSVPAVTIREGVVSVSATPGGEYDDRAQTRVLIHGKNDWDGSALTLRYFVTPDDPDVIRTGRDILLKSKDSLESGAQEMASLRRAKLICDAFAGKLMYVRDPRQVDDYVQYPSETFRLHGGDCADMTVCFASLLSSIGIATAFVDVVPPGEPEKAHVFMLFDTGVDPKFGTNVSPNPKRFVVRRLKSGQETIWLPLEPTAITHGFDEAWTAGAQEYFDTVEIGLGLIKGWVHIVDVY